MTDETLSAFLTRRERELRNQISGLNGQIEQMRGQLGQREQELREIQRVRASLTLAGGNFSGSMETVVGLPPLSGNANIAGEIPPEILQRFNGMTIKQLVIQALGDNFKSGGTAIAIRDFVQDAYGRDILPSSLRPQLARLKAQGIIEQDPKTDTWALSEMALRHNRWYGKIDLVEGDEEPSENKPETRPRDTAADPDFIKAARKRSGDFLE
jgi:hypothetical protein